jgi:hypothetical protein
MPSASAAWSNVIRASKLVSIGTATPFPSRCALRVMVPDTSDKRMHPCRGMTQVPQQLNLILGPKDFAQMGDTRSREARQAYEARGGEVQS